MPVAPTDAQRLAQPVQQRAAEAELALLGILVSSRSLREQRAAVGRWLQQLAADGERELGAATRSSYLRGITEAARDLSVPETPVSRGAT